MSGTMPALRTQDLTIQFGGLRAVSELSIEVPSRTIFGLIGPNGAGKTTAFNLLTGVYRPTAGRVQVFGRDTARLKPSEITRLGIARTFQNIRLFRNLPVIDNLRIALDHSPELAGLGMIASVLRTRAAQEREQRVTRRAEELLRMFGLQERASWEARNLAYGDQRRLEIARAMATGARLLLLDEPAAGLNPQETHALMILIRELRDRHGMTVLLIEHDMKLVMGVCERIAVMEYGVKIAEGRPEQVRNDPKVIEAYLGKGAARDAGN